MKIIIFFILLLFVYFGMFFYMRSTKTFKDHMGEIHIFCSEYQFYLFYPLEYADHHLTGVSYHTIGLHDKSIGKEVFIW